MKRLSLASLAMLAGLMIMPAGNAYSASLVNDLGGPVGFGPDSVARGDDTWLQVDVSAEFPNDLNFAGTFYDIFWANQNGNITFDTGVGTYTPQPFPCGHPMFAAWWLDIDTRAVPADVNENLVWYFKETGRFVVTFWETGYYNLHLDLRNSFQIIVTDRSADFAPGDFDVEYRYNRCEWLTGDASGGAGGFGGTMGSMGFDLNDGTTFWQHPDSFTANIINLCTADGNTLEGGVPVPGVWRFE
ncbi:MAG: hypothetical protein KKB70_01985, partial [Proteobacteria bacterium]|nr:hypothetical protein [Pseudomonadota bacterium]